MNVAQILIKRLRELFRFPGIAKRKTALPKSSRVSPARAAEPRGLASEWLSSRRFPGVGVG
jgi:hypothetical protein